MKNTVRHKPFPNIFKNRYVANFSAPVFGFFAYMFGDIAYHFYTHSGKYLNPESHVLFETNPEYYSIGALVSGLLGISSAIITTNIAYDYFNSKN